MTREKFTTTLDTALLQLARQKAAVDGLPGLTSFLRRLYGCTSPIVPWKYGKSPYRAAGSRSSLFATIELSWRIFEVGISDGRLLPSITPPISWSLQAGNRPTNSKRGLETIGAFRPRMGPEVQWSED